MDMILTHLPQSLAVIGLALLAIEVLVLGMETFILLFLGLGCICSAILVWGNMIPATLTSAILSTAICTAIAGVALWMPLRRMQGKVDHKQIDNDLVGHTFILAEEVDRGKQPIYRYSGIDWKLISDVPIAAGIRVEVTHTQVGEFYIKEKAE